MGVLIMKLLLVSALCLMAASPAWSTCLGSVNIKDYGDVFIMAPDWAAGAISIQNNGFTMRGNSRLYFGNRCENGWAPDAYAQIPLNNKHFAYTLDLSNVPCHCNAAAYFVKMPGNNPGDGVRRDGGQQAHHRLHPSHLQRGQRLLGQLRQGRLSDQRLQRGQQDDVP